MPEYTTFWEKMSVHYPVSKGEIRLPIASELIEIPDFDLNSLVKNLQKLLQQILDQYGDVDSARKRARLADEERISSLITNELTGVIRFDCVLDKKTDQVRIVEINCDYPDGLLLHDKTYSVISGETNHLHEDLYLKLFPKDEDAYVLHAKNVGFLDAYQTEADLLSQNRLVDIGSDFDVAKKYKIIKRSLEVSKLTKEDIAVLNPDKNRFINTFALRTLGYKDLLAKIDHPLIPKTVSITKENQEDIIENKNTLVIKPLNGCEGEGIYFGKDNKTKEWAKLIDKICDLDYVAQEMIEIKKMPVSFYESGEIRDKELYFDMCPHFFISHGKVIGSGHILMRFSENKVVNISQGGGIGYYKL